MATGLQGLLSRQSPDSIRGATRAPARAASAGFALDGVISQIDRVEEEKGALAGEFMRSFIEGQFRKRGIPLQLKSRGERELEQRQSDLALAKLKDLERSNQVRNTAGFLLDGASTPVNQIFGGDDTRTLEEAFDTKLDASILQRPDDLVRISQMLSKVPGYEEYGLSRSDLLLNEFTSSFAQQTAGQRDADRLSDQTKAQVDSAENVEFQQELQSGDSPVAQSLFQRLDKAGEAIGQDIVPDGAGGGVPFARFFGDDFDEAKGSAGVVKGVLDHGEQFQALGPEVMLGVLLGSVGKRIGSVLQGGDVLQAPDGRRILMAGDGGLSNDPQAIRNYMALLSKISQNTGRPVSELLSLMGLPFEGFDESEVQQASLDLFGQNE